MTRRPAYVFFALVTLLAATSVVSLACYHEDPVVTPTQDSVVRQTYSIVALPDTQHYVEDPELNKIFAAQIDWILKNVDSLNIVFVTQLGDVVYTVKDQQQ